MLDRAPILLGPAPDLASVGDHAIGVGAIGTVQRFDPVEIGESPPIECDIVAPLDTGDPIGAKAYGLVDADPDIEQDQRKQHRVDDGRGDDGTEGGAGEKRPHARLEFPLFDHDAALEFDKPVMDPHAQRPPPMFDLAIEFGLQIDDGPCDLLHALRHAAVLAVRGSSASIMTFSAFVSGAREKTSYASIMSAIAK